MQKRILNLCFSQALSSVSVRRFSASTVCSMKRRTLGNSDLEVSECCLGTMTFGIQVGEEQTHQILDKAIKEMDINFLDTAEMYVIVAKPGNFRSTMQT
mmetsp:Transcript_8401/g.37554  ORF Transcript_8401/g.37554 Transcript_8401/m.37554 type:complete len:99 (-) Transcript_8401:2755-3051(-)